MTAIEVVPTLDELSLVHVRGQQCMPGVETNLGELLLTAAETTPDNVCLEVEAESYQDSKHMLSFISSMVQGTICFPVSKRTLIHHKLPKVHAFFVNLYVQFFARLNAKYIQITFCLAAWTDARLPDRSLRSLVWPVPSAKFFAKLWLRWTSPVPQMRLQTLTNVEQTSMWWPLCLTEVSKASQQYMPWCSKGVRITHLMSESQWKSFEVGWKSLAPQSWLPMPLC